MKAGMRSSCGRLHVSGHREGGVLPQMVRQQEIQLLHETVAVLPPHQTFILALLIVLNSHILKPWGGILSHFFAAAARTLIFNHV